MPQIPHHISSQPTKTKGENFMSKELAKTYDPKGLEDRLYQKWLDKKYFHAEVNPEQEAVYHRDPAAKRYRTAAYGPCAGRDDAGYPDPV